MPICENIGCENEGIYMQDGLLLCHDCYCENQVLSANVEDRE